MNHSSVSATTTSSFVGGIGIHDLGEVPTSAPALFTDIKQTIGSHLVLPTNTTVAATLWIAHTHLLDKAEHCPRLVFSSSDPECGKSTALGIISCLVPNPAPSSNMTPAAMVRALDRNPRPTLICDELDSLQPEQRAALRNVVNSGHARDTAFFTRCEPNKEGRWKGVQFSTFGSIALGMIGEVPDTIRSRAIHIPLKRALPGEQRTRLTPGAKAALKDMGKTLAEVVRNLDIDDDPELPPELSNRDADNWRPIIAIADAVGGMWPEWARQAAIALTTQRQLTDGEKLLSDIREVFGKKAVMRSEALAEELSGQA